jgi:hypothetical protein
MLFRKSLHVPVMYLDDKDYRIFNVHSLLTIVANKRMLLVFFDSIHLIHAHCDKYSSIMLAVLSDLCTFP